MLEIRDGVESFKLSDRQVLITPELKKVRIPLEVVFPPLKLEDLPEKLIKRLKKRDIIVSSIVNKKKPSYEKKLLLEKITLKDLDIKRVQYIFQEILKNCSMAPVITIDCSLEVTSKLLNLISQKYNENSINPIVKIFIRERVEEFLRVIKEFLDARESIELNNLILVIHHTNTSREIIKKARENVDPLEIYLYYEKIPHHITKLDQLNWNYDLPVLLELNEQINHLDFSQIKKVPIHINDDSIFRLVSAFKLKAYTVHDVIRKQLFVPYCGACNSRLFIEGSGKIYGCNTGYRSNDQLGTLENKSLKEWLNSKKFKDIRKKIEMNSRNSQKNSSLSNFYSGCLYHNDFQKFNLMKNLLQLLI